MSKTAITSWKNKPLSQFVLDRDGTFTLLTLATLGVIGALLHQHLRMGLNLPGHHGLEWMALLVLGRCQSRHRWAASVVALGAISACLSQSVLLASLLSVKSMLFYALNGLVLDLLFRVTPRNAPLALKGAVLGGLTFMLKPALLIPAVMALELQIGSFAKHGYLFPLLTHFAFGTIGALCGLAMSQALTRHRTSTQHQH